ncbi:MAG TPA: 1,4-alpha-glucan branching protein domain-containing protein, partial [Treponemataceae bacterium]|nr:1,4-alpha-glucan branching protein domain-containing protein [Treponemataceae bacterium]
THGLLFANPVPKNGGFSPVRTKNYLALFARNYDSCVDITDDYDFFYNDIYRCEARDIGYEASAKDLSEILFKDGVRFETGFKYWTRKKSAEKAYDPIAASKQVVKDATTFLDARAKKLGEAEKLCKTDVSLVDTFYLPDLGHNWYESVEWLEQVFRQAAKRDDIELKSCSSLVKNQYNLPLVEPTASATTPRGYGDELLDSTNSWMLRYVRKATERMLDLATRFTENTGLKARTLDLAAKQIMIAQSGDWAKMVHLAHNANFADTRFRMSIANFTTVFEYLGANEMSTEWLTRIERQDSLFPWMNYRVFSSKS